MLVRSLLNESTPHISVCEFQDGLTPLDIARGGWDHGQSSQRLMSLLTRQLTTEQQAQIRGQKEAEERRRRQQVSRTQQLVFHAQKCEVV